MVGWSVFSLKFRGEKGTVMKKGREGGGMGERRRAGF